MLPGLTGSLLSHYFAEHVLASTFGGELGEESCSSAHRQFTLLWRRGSRTLGPASSARAILDDAVAPLASLLGFDAARDGAIAPNVSLLVGLWSDDLDTLWRAAVRTAIHRHAEWCLCANGHQLRGGIKPERGYRRRKRRCRRVGERVGEVPDVIDGIDAG